MYLTQQGVQHLRYFPVCQNQPLAFNRMWEKQTGANLFAASLCRLCARWSSTGVDSDTTSCMSPAAYLTTISRKTLSVSSTAIRSGLLSMTKLILVQLGFRRSILSVIVHLNVTQATEEEVVKRQGLHCAYENTFKVSILKGSKIYCAAVVISHSPA